MKRCHDLDSYDGRGAIHALSTGWKPSDPCKPVDKGWVAPVMEHTFL